MNLGVVAGDAAETPSKFPKFRGKRQIAPESCPPELPPLSGHNECQPEPRQKYLPKFLSYRKKTLNMISSGVFFQPQLLVLLDRKLSKIRRCRG